ncbi:MAG: enoyl-CoA hydratase/isomerase family protein [Flavobacteriales bacterium]|nr:enoyl-CoA hydratase/isomerase family protein [Flavobacteriales bacterium]
MNYPLLLVTSENHIATIIINRPDKLNALNMDVIAQLGACMQQLESDADIRAIILTGSGEKAFVAGADISEFAHFNVEQGRTLAAKGQKTLFDVVENLRTPVIAAVNGFALGGGLELAMSCHIRVASDNARMGLPEVSLGVIPGYGGTQRLPLLIGRGRANELITTAQMLKAQPACDAGLVNYVVPQEDLLNKCKEIALKIAANSPTAVGYALQAVNAGFDSSQNGFNEEVELFGKAFGTADFKEGTTAFLEKRKPNFKGE